MSNEETEVTEAPTRIALSYVANQPPKWLTNDVAAIHFTELLQYVTLRGYAQPWERELGITPAIVIVNKDTKQFLVGELPDDSARLCFTSDELTTPIRLNQTLTPESAKQVASMLMLPALMSVFRCFFGDTELDPKFLDKYLRIDRAKVYLSRFRESEREFVLTIVMPVDAQKLFPEPVFTRVAWVDPETLESRHDVLDSNSQNFLSGIRA